MSLQISVVLLSFAGAIGSYLLGRWSGVVVGTLYGEKQQWFRWREQMLKNSCCPLCQNSLSRDEGML